jgi:hypothetical protein
MYGGFTQTYLIFYMTKSKFIYQPGDRVAERPKAHGIYTRNDEVRKRISQYREQRYGTVIDTKIKKNSFGRSQVYVSVQWDNTNRVCEHAQFRLCHLKDFDRIMSEACAAIGE